MTQTIYQKFKDTGTLHVLAASGANVGYVVVTITILLRLFRLPRRYRYVLLLIAVLLFSFLAYNQPSVVRASLMAVIGLVGLALYRDSNWLNTVSLAGLIILAFSPLYLFDVGCQLSFAGVYALVLFMPSFEPILPKQKKLMSNLWRYFLLIILGSLVVQLGVMPILIYHFHSVPLVSLIANVVVVPLVGTASGLGIILIFASGIPVINAFVSDILALNVTLVLKSIDFFNNLSIPPIRIGAPEMLVVIMYYLILQILFLLFAKKKSVALFVSLFIACLTIFVWKEVIAGEEFNARITFLDTNDINTTFVERSSGSTILINGGGQEGGIDRGESVVLPFLLTRGISRIDSLIATTESGNNRASMVSVINGLGDVKSAAHDPVSDSTGLSRRINRADPMVLLKIDTLNIALLTQFSSVQDLHNLPSHLDVLAVDWSYLELDKLPKILSSFRVGTLIITNYPKKFSSTRQIETLRKEFAEIPIFSVLESGGITVVIHDGRAKVLPFSHSRF